VGDELPYASLATPGGGLRYDVPAGHFMINWKTPRTPGLACYRVSMTARDESAIHTFVQATR